MRLPARLLTATLALSAIAFAAPGVANAATGGAASRATAPSIHSGQNGYGHSVFVQTDSTSGNQIDVYDQAPTGLTFAGSYGTGGKGGVESGAVVDDLASQSSLVYDPGSSTLYAVNAGSNTISVFFVWGDRLFLLQVLPSGGEFPVSIAVRGNLVYVLNAGGAGSVQGYGRFGPFLFPIPHASQSLNLSNTNPPNYLMGPGQVGFTPDGRQLIVTTKASGSNIDVFSVGFFGSLSPPVVNASSSPVPFSFVFAPDGSLVVAEALHSTVSTYVVNPNGTLSAEASLADGQGALCWITTAQGVDYVANAGSNDLSAYRVGPGGSLSLVGSTGVVATTGAGPIDMAASPGGQYLYAEAGGAGAVDEFAVNSNGNLSAIGSVTITPGIEGIATS
ncbi:MAG: lactonase family protein [Acidimicrobiales bacterium]